MVMSVVSQVLGTIWIAMGVGAYTARRRATYLNPVLTLLAILILGIAVSVVRSFVTPAGCITAILVILTLLYAAAIIFSPVPTRAEKVNRLAPELGLTILFIAAIHFSVVEQYGRGIVALVGCAGLGAYIIKCGLIDRQLRKLEDDRKGAARRKKERDDQRRVEAEKRKETEECEARRRQERGRQQRAERDRRRISESNKRLEAERLVRERHEREAARERQERIGRKLHQIAEASRKYTESESKEILRFDFDLLDALVIKTGGDIYNGIPIYDVREPTQTLADVRVRATRLEQRGFISIDAADDEYWNEILYLTRDGRRFVDDRNNDTEKGDIYVSTGDTNVNIGGTQISKSYVNESFNVVKEAHGDDIAQALKVLNDAVQASNDEDAIIHLNEFNKELTSVEPRKPILRTLFNAIVAATPAVSSMTDVVQKITQLFSGGA